MIELPEFVEFRYSEPEWDQINAVVPDEFRHEFDQITRRSMEVAASAYLPQAALNRQRLGRDELETLRDDAESLRARIAGALAMHLDVKNAGPHAIPRPGVRHDMLDATDNYFAKLARTLDHQIKTAEPRTRRDSARKIERDELWTQLLALWIDIGGKPTSKATVNFLIAAAAPVDADADFEAVEQWLKRRRQSKTTKKVRSMPRRRVTR